MLPLTSLLFLVLTLDQGATLRGVVKDPHGKLCEEAEVILVSPGLPQIQKPSILRTRTNGRGRFQFSAGFGPGSYVWAHGKEAGGSFFCTTVERNVRPGLVLHLEGTGRRIFEAVRLDGIQAWGEPGELRLVWDLDGTGVYTREMPISGSGLAKIPPSFPLFLDRRLFWVREAGGRKLFAAALFWEKGRDGVLRPEKESLGVEDSGLLRFSCPKPRSLSVVVRTKVVGKPLSGAKISLFLPYSRLRWVEGGVTNSKGMAHLIVPEFQEDSRVAMLVRKKGFSAEVGYYDKENAYLGRAPRELRPQELVKEWTFSLEKAEPLVGKVVGWKAEEDGLGLVRLELSFGMGGYPQGRLGTGGARAFCPGASVWGVSVSEYSKKHFPLAGLLVPDSEGLGKDVGKNQSKRSPSPQACPHDLMEVQADDKGKLLHLRQEAPPLGPLPNLGRRWRTPPFPPGSLEDEGDGVEKPHLVRRPLGAWTAELLRPGLSGRRSLRDASKAMVLDAKGRPLCQGREGPPSQGDSGASDPGSGRRHHCGQGWGPSGRSEDSARGLGTCGSRSSKTLAP